MGSGDLLFQGTDRREETQGGGVPVRSNVRENARANRHGDSSLRRSLYYSLLLVLTLSLTACDSSGSNSSDPSGSITVVVEEEGSGDEEGVTLKVRTYANYGHVILDSIRNLPEQAANSIEILAI